MAKKKNTIYLVDTGHEVISFYSWPKCQTFVRGKNYAFVGGASRAEAEAKLQALLAGAPKIQRQKTQPSLNLAFPKPTIGICSDAGTHGNPGPCSYRVCELDGEILEEKDLGVHTNNYAELAGIGAMIQIAIKKGASQLYTDSAICMGWIKTGRVGATVHERPVILKMVAKIQLLLSKNQNLKILKWHTKKWGEIPADFGRKG